MASIIKVDTIQSTTANVFFQNSSGTEYARFDSGGNLGIGTSSPNANSKLDVAGISQSSNASYPAFQLYNSGLASNAYFRIAYDAANNLVFNNVNNAYNSSTEFMRINSSGNVGIGTSSPSSSYIAKFLQVDNATSSGVVLNAARKFSIYSSSSSTLSFLDETAGAERMRIDSSGNLSFNSGYGSVATAYGCRAWVNFNGTGTVAIRASGNVTSITDNNVGNYTVNFTNAMPDANYAVTFGVGGGGSGLNSSFVAGVLTSTQYGTASNKNTTALQFTTGDYTATLRDFGEIYVSIFR